MATTWPPLEDYYRNPSGEHCVNDALTQLLGYDPGLPPRIDTQKVPGIARRLGLSVINEGSIDVRDYAGRPVVVTYIVEENVYGPGMHQCHAEYTRRLPEFMAYLGFPVIVGLIYKRAGALPSASQTRRQHGRRETRPHQEYTTTGDRAMFSWLGEILDVSKGIDDARDDVALIRTPEAANAVLWFDVALALIWLGLWFRYDLYSTSEYFTPIVDEIVQMAPVAMAPILGIIGRFIFNLGPTLIQWRYPVLAQRHKSAYWAFMLAIGFDVVTDFPLVFDDVRRFFGGAIVWADQWALGWAMHYGLAFFGVIFASFVFQSLFVIQGAKVMMLMKRRSHLSRAATARAA